MVIWIITEHSITCQPTCLIGSVLSSRWIFTSYANFLGPRSNFADPFFVSWKHHRQLVVLAACSIHLLFGFSLIESFCRNLQRFRLFDPDRNFHVQNCFPLNTQDQPPEDFCPLWSAISFDCSKLVSTPYGNCHRWGLLMLLFVGRAFYDQQNALHLIDTVNKGSCCQAGSGLE